MAKKYVLVDGLKTFATLTQKFVAGVEYSEEDVADALTHENEDGDSFFMEIEVEEGDGGGEGGEAQPAKKISFGKGGKGSKGVKAPAADEGDIDTAMGKGPAGGEDGKTVTV